MDGLLRLLELVRRELQAQDAHLRLGGDDADAPPLQLAHPLQPGCRLVVRFASPVADLPAARARLAELAGAFTGTVSHAIELLDRGAHRASLGDGLVDVLADLRDATASSVALVVDRQSPIIWGSSDPAVTPADRPDARAIAAGLVELAGRGVDPLHEATADAPVRAPQVGASRTRRALRAAEQARPGGASTLAATARALVALDDATTDGWPRSAEGPGVASKEFGGLYRVVLVFEDDFSPLRVEGVLRRAVPVIERHVLELPPLDPTPQGGRVLPLRRD